MTKKIPTNAVEDHGGNLDRAGDCFGYPPDGWLDLSTGINPRAYALPEIGPDVWQRLPSSSSLHALKVAAARAYGAASESMIACAPGTQALIQILPRVIGADRVAILGPTYSEHAAAWRAAGAAVEETSDLPPPDRTVVLVNPNNPDGRVIEPDRLITWAKAAAPSGHGLIVDEAFADVLPGVSIVPELPRAHVVVLRSFGKFFGLAGMRLGFAVTGAGTVRRLESEMGPWAVSGPALTAGTAALADSDWATAERRRLAEEMKRLRALVQGTGAEIVGGTDLFVLVEHVSAADLYEHLGRVGILVRRFEGNNRWLRFGLPGSEGGWLRLEQALHRFKGTSAGRAREYG